MAVPASSAPRRLLAALAGSVRRAAAPPTDARLVACGEAAEAELWQLFNLSLALQRDLGPRFVDLDEPRLAAARALRAWALAPAPAGAACALSRVVRLVQDDPFCFTSTFLEPGAAPRRPDPEASRPAGPRAPAAVAAWARRYTVAYPDLASALASLLAAVPASTTRARLVGMAARADNAQRAAWKARRLVLSRT